MSESITWQGEVTAEAEVELEITAACGNCGDELDISNTNVDGNQVAVDVDRCKCEDFDIGDLKQQLLAARRALVEAEEKRMVDAVALSDKLKAAKRAIDDILEKEKL